MAAGNAWSMRRLLRQSGARPAPASWIALLALLVLFAWTGIRAIDFGHHWDEHQHIGRTARYVSTGVLLQEDYNYPSLTVRLLAGALLPERLHGARQSAGPERGLREVVTSHAFLLRARSMFVLLSSLVGLWSFLLVWLLCRSSVWAVLGAGMTLSSWEVAYPARWLAPDTVLMQFAILTQLLALLTSRREGILPVVAAGVAAALTCSAKWTGGIVLLSVLLAALFGPRSPARGSRHPALAAPTTRVLVACIAFAAVVLFVTPTLYLEPAQVVESLRKQVRIYGQAGHFGYDTSGFFDHLRLLLAYYVGSAPSPWPPGSLLLAALAVVGGLALARARREAAVLLLVPVSLSLFMASQRVMIVRNVLLVLPIGAILAALGGRALAQRLSGTSAARAAPLVPLVCLAIVAANAGWLHRASGTIRDHAQVDVLRELVRYVDAHPGAVVNASVQLGGRLRSRYPERSFAPCVPSESSDALCAMLSTEAQGRDRKLWPANRIHYRLLPSGPYEVNWDYYPTWEGPERIVMVRSADVLRTSLRDVVTRAW